ncbi:adenosylcobinamide-GDP ribazoletransferase [Lysinibacillus odysseyi]|uniref:adenosylcobinamide-GDP ribazoletransferase n=1 Tax=Lysinibacillus odysseyi TaxID=202611 RepID=UPI00147032BB|nr:adenosylcobinamide-GDP ribazoletransferase [Lysinibacillus odysseyi]
MTGIVLALQFFSALPIRKAFEMNARSATVMYGAIPLIGLGIGALQAIFLTVNDTYFTLSPLFTAILLVVLHFVATGGLHMDGVIDTGDAYFSYRDQKKRLEILDDPRIGAFGAMTLVLFVLLKVGVLYELLLRGLPLLYVILVPFIARQAVILVFITTKPSKETGIASYFKKTVNERTLLWIVISYFIGILAIVMILQNWLLLVLYGALLAFTGLYRSWVKRNFGGVSGDLLGAIFEWGELILWFVLLCIL